jgi:5'-3' exonuclease
VAGPLLIVDAPSLLYRAFYALPKSITDGEGQPVNALLGTTNLLLREVEEHDPRAVVLCFGPDAARYRVELYEPYHAERPASSRPSAGHRRSATTSRPTTSWDRWRSSRRRPGERRCS